LRLSKERFNKGGALNEGREPIVRTLKGGFFIKKKDLAVEEKGLKRQRKKPCSRELRRVGFAPRKKKFTRGGGPQTKKEKTRDGVLRGNRHHRHLIQCLTSKKKP